MADEITRRTFFKQSTMLAFGSIVAIRCRKEDGAGPDPFSCTTTDDILGPFYKAGSPFREQIDPNPDPATTLIIKGTVFHECDTPLGDAVVEIWNADVNGEYDLSDDYHFRGSYRTSTDGQYVFRTIIPGRYLNGQTFRPSHIHFRITAPGHAELISQIYFRDDPFIPVDPWASSTKAKDRILQLTTDTNGEKLVTFDVHLPKHS
jgi:catechol 1,2-dioxygenase